jgi:hypothetical protein
VFASPAAAAIPESRPTVPVAALELLERVAAAEIAPPRPAGDIVAMLLRRGVED